MKANDLPWQVQLALIGAGVLAIVAWRVGSIKKGAEIVGSAAVSAATGVTVGVVGTAGEIVGLPAPSQTFDDPAIGRWTIDNKGYFAASKWFTAGAFFAALAMDEGTGTAPPLGSVLYSI